VNEDKDATWEYRRSNLGPLYNLLLKACPPDKTGKRSIPRLAELCGKSPSAIYNAIRKQKISGQLAARVVRVSEGRVKRNEFNEWVYVEK